MSPAVSARHRPLRWVAAGIAALGATVFTWPAAWIQGLENHALDFRFQLRAPARAEPTSVIVGVADSTLTLADRVSPALLRTEPALAAVAAPWPWHRGVYADLVRQLRAGGARAIVFDFLFDAENAGDAEFARALAEPGAPVVLASLALSEAPADGSRTVKHQLPRPALLAAVEERTGYADVFPDERDGVLRTLTATKRRTEFSGQPPVHGEEPLASLAYAAGRVVRPDGAAAAAGYIDFLGPDGTIPMVPIEDLFDPGRKNSGVLATGRFFRDRVVWVGGISEVQFKDIYFTPLGRMTGVEAQAQAFETLIGRGPLRAPSNLATALCGWGLAVVAVAVAWTSRRISRQLAIVGAVALGWGALAVLLFVQAGVVWPVVAPLGAWLVAGGGGVGVRFIQEQRERRRLRGMLGRYVSEEVARVIVDQPEEFSQSLRGGRRPVTVLFADLRGFTSWVEHAEPEAFVAQLNEYFGAVVDCVLAQGGTLQKFIGDAVLTVWGDTRSAGAAADTARAVEAALAMQAAVARLNQSWAGRADRTAMAIGIGLHHGVAMVGNVGHVQRMEFTVLGDVVNVAARLESANRQLATTVLVSETVRDLIVDTHRCVPLGRFGLKGRREAVGLFVPLGPRTEPEPVWCDQAETARAAWARGDFAIAAEHYAELARRAPPLAEFFLQQAERARRFRAERPADWTGEYRFDSK